MKITIFESVSQPQGRKPCEASLAEAFSEPVRVPTKTEAPLWSPTEFLGDLAHKAKALQLHAIVLDLDGTSDGLTPQELASVRSALESLNVSYALHSTYSSANKWRVVVPLAAPLPVAKAQQAIAALAARVAHPSFYDQTSEHYWRRYFVPSIPLDAPDGYFTCHIVEDRPLYDPSQAVFSNVFDQLNKTSVNHNIKEPQDITDILELSTQKHIDLNKYAFILGQLSQSSPDPEAFRAKVWTYARAGLELNTTPVKDWAAAERTCAQALEAGRMSKPVQRERTLAEHLGFHAAFGPEALVKRMAKAHDDESLSRLTVQLLLALDCDRAEALRWLQHHEIRSTFLDVSMNRIAQMRAKRATDGPTFTPREFVLTKHLKTDPEAILRQLPGVELSEEQLEGIAAALLELPDERTALDVCHKLRRSPHKLDWAARTLVLHEDQAYVHTQLTQALIYGYTTEGEKTVTRAETELAVSRAQERASDELDKALAKIAEAQARPPRSDWANLTLDKHGLPVPSEDNILELLFRSGAQISRDVRKGVFFTAPAPWHNLYADNIYPKPLNFDSEQAALSKWVKDKLGKPPQSLRALRSAWWAWEHSDLIPETDYFRDYLLSLKWDGHQRLGTWLHSYMGAKDSVVTREYGTRWLIGAVMRTFEPGCKMDNVLVLVGGQGVGKSSSLARLLPSTSLFTDTLPNIYDKDAHIDLSRFAIAELSELHHMAADADRFKAFLTTSVGYVRAAYATSAKAWPRRGVLAGTTNSEQGFLTDPSGNRRFWPVKVSLCDVDSISRDRDQLWAEAMHLYLSGEDCFLDRETEILAEDDRRANFMEHGPYDEMARLLTTYLEKGVPPHLIGESGLFVDPKKAVFAPGQLDEKMVPSYITLEQAAKLLGVGLAQARKAITHARFSESTCESGLKSWGLSRKYTG